MHTFKFAKVEGWSMMPLLKAGDIVAYKQSDYNVGDVLLFKYDQLVLMHRLIKNNTQQLLMKGDNIPLWDRVIEKQDVIGVAEYVIRKNRVIYLNNPSINKRYVNYSIREMKLISFIKVFFKIKSYAPNTIIKHMLLPFLIWNYLLLLTHSKKNHNLLLKIKN